MIKITYYRLHNGEILTDLTFAKAHARSLYNNARARMLSALAPGGLRDRSYFKMSAAIEDNTYHLGGLAMYKVVTPAVGYKTSDDVIHATLDEATIHAEERYQSLVTSLAHTFATAPNLANALDENLELLQTLAALKTDITLDPTDEDDDQ